jgi:DNA invertase Pin-like site-specific DNA recombinase
MIAIYIRVSTKKQENEGYSLEVQESEGKAFAQKQGLESKIYKDVESGAKASRKAYLALVNDIEAGLITYLWVKKYDRIARDLIIAETLKKLLKQYKIKLYEGNTYLDLENEGVDIATVIQGKLSETERTKIAARLTMGLHKMYDDGLRVYTNLYGWKSEGYTDAGKVKWVIVDEEKKLIQLAYKLALEENLGLSAICRKVSELGYRKRDGSPWGHTSIRQILTVEVFAGFTHDSKGKPIKSKVYEAIVSEDDYRKMKIKYPKTITKKRRGRPNEHIGSGGILICGKCGSKYTYWKGWNINKQGIKHYKYSYVHKSRNGCTNQKCYSQKAIDIMVYLAFCRITSIGKNILENLKSKSNNSKYIDEKKRIEENIKNIELEMLNLKQAIKKGVHNDILINDINRNDDDLIKLNSNLEIINKKIENEGKLYNETIINFGKQKYFDWEKAENDKERNIMAKQFIKNIFINDDMARVVYIDDSECEIKYSTKLDQIFVMIRTKELEMYSFEK